MRTKVLESFGVIGLGNRQNNCNCWNNEAWKPSVRSELLAWERTEQLQLLEQTRAEALSGLAVAQQDILTHVRSFG